jgi:aldose sugar dehydrogenase
MNPRTVTAAAAVLIISIPGMARGQQSGPGDLNSEYQNLRLVRVAPATHPWAIAPLAGGRLLVTERGGRLLLIGSDGSRTEVSGVPDVHVRNQGGLLDVVLHPDHANNGLIYLTYSIGSADSTTTALGRGRLDGSRLVDFRQVFVSNAWGPPGGHYGSRIVFLRDGTLLMTVGDRMRTPARAQNPLDHAGSILRLRDDGSVPPDNPFAGNPAYAPELYSYGHRNIQGMALHPVSGDVWVFEHGPRGSDLLHRVVPGGNHGWPQQTRGREYRTQEPFGTQTSLGPLGQPVQPGAGAAARAAPGAAAAAAPAPRAGTEFIDPVHEFVITIAPSGLTFVTGGGWHETWQGNLLGGGLRAQRMVRMVLENRELVHAEELLTQRIGRIRDVRQGPDGNIYIATDAENGGIYRLEPRSSNE